MDDLTGSQQKTVASILGEAQEIAFPIWRDYNTLKNRLEQNGIYESRVLKQLADALRL